MATIDIHDLSGKKVGTLDLADEVFSAINEALLWLAVRSRNLEGIELVASSEVHPYHLLRYDRVIFSQPAIEKLQVSLKKSVPKGSREAGEAEPKAKKAARSPRQRSKKAAEVA